MEEKNTIIIVDDQESIIKSLKRLLLPEPYHILSASGGDDALEIIKKNNQSIEEERKNIFLIISDQRMPNMTGTQFLEKTVNMLPNAMRFILSGYADRDDILQSINQGVTHRYLTKPWNSDELIIMISQALESPDKVRELAISRPAESELPEINRMDMEIQKFEEHRKDLFLGRVALHHGFITQDQLDSSLTAMQIARQSGRNVSLENILFEKNLISSEDMSKIVAVTRRRMGKTFAKTAIQNFGVTQFDIERGLQIQAQEFNNTTTCRLLGDILVAEKIITEEQKESIIIDQIYSEREMLASEGGNETASLPNDNIEDGVVGVGISDRSNELILKRKKKSFLRQRALDKIFSKAVINRNFSTESEILNALEFQMLHFTKTFQLRLIKDILVERSIISQTQADDISNSIAQPHQQHTSTQKQEQTDHADSIGNIISTDKREPFEISVSEDGLDATIRLAGDMPKNMSVEALKKTLGIKHQIVYGLVDDVSIELFLRQVASKKDKFIIARGKPAKSGRNGVIKYLFESENSHFGKELASGRFDYRDRGEIPNVTQGTILAEKIPPILPINGITVRGTEITVPTPTDVNLDCGQGVEISKDGLKAVAAANGRPDISLTGKISVFPEKIIKGNVDFRTGNVKFSGDIIIHGSILPGFSVTGGNLTVNDIDEADVNISNSLSVKNNINGSLIKTGVLLTAQTIKKSKVIALGDVVVQKEIIDCTIITSGKVIVPRGRIVASTIYAAKGIEAMNIGSEVSPPCRLFPGADDHARDIIKAFDENINRHKENIVKLEAVEKQYQHQSLRQLNDLSELSRLQERLAVERQKTLEDKKFATSSIVKKQMDEFLADLDKRALKMDETINSLFDENDTLQTKISELKAKLKSIRTDMQGILKDKNGFKKWHQEQKELSSKQGVGLTVHGTVFAGTQITGNNCSMTVKNNIKNSIIQQTVNMNDPNNPFNEMLVVPLSAAGKPHVYRT
ncbi:MAG: DUF342 domain-containing protein [Desulfamplus sp.]|nr:DUF342 domain-containing protein [Desulfamplus sp.]